MAYVMLQYDRPTDTRHWNAYNQQVRGWIDQLLHLPGALSFVAFRTVDGTSPNTFTLLEFGTTEQARTAVGGEPMSRIRQELRAVGAVTKVLVVERSPFTPEPIRA
jgi:hypothetical protein